MKASSARTRTIGATVSNNLAVCAHISLCSASAGSNPPGRNLRTAGDSRGSSKHSKQSSMMLDCFRVERLARDLRSHTAINTANANSCAESTLTTTLPILGKSESAKNPTRNRRLSSAVQWSPTGCASIAHRSWNYQDHLSSDAFGRNVEINHNAVRFGLMRRVRRDSRAGYDPSRPATSAAVRAPSCVTGVARRPLGGAGPTAAEGFLHMVAHGAAMVAQPLRPRLDRRRAPRHRQIAARLVRSGQPDQHPAHLRPLQVRRVVIDESDNV